MISLPKDYRRLLTPQQNAVLDCLVQGKSTQDVCDELGIAEPTMKMHLSRAMRATGASNRVELVVAAMQVELHALRAIQADNDEMHAELVRAQLALGREHKARLEAEAKLAGALAMAEKMRHVQLAPEASHVAG